MPHLAHSKLSNIPGGGRSTGYIGMCNPKECGFSAVLVKNRVWFSHSSLRSSRFLSFSWRRGDRKSERKAGEQRSTPGVSQKIGENPYCLFCHSFAVFLTFASVWKRKGRLLRRLFALQSWIGHAVSFFERSYLFIIIVKTNQPKPFTIPLTLASVY